MIVKYDCARQQHAFRMLMEHHGITATRRLLDDTLCFDVRGVEVRLGPEEVARLKALPEMKIVETILGYANGST